MYNLPDVATDTSVPTVPDVGDLLQSEPSTQKEYEIRYQSWGRGSREQFAVWDYLSNRERLVETQDFFFLPQFYTGSLAQFYIGPMVWRIKGEGIRLSTFQDAFQRSKLEGSGLHVVDLEAQDLQYGLATSTLQAAMHGTELHPANTFKNTNLPERPDASAVTLSQLGSY